MLSPVSMSMSTMFQVGWVLSGMVIIVFVKFPMGVIIRSVTTLLWNNKTIGYQLLDLWTFIVPKMHILNTEKWQYSACTKVKNCKCSPLRHSWSQSWKNHVKLARLGIFANFQICLALHHRSVSCPHLSTHQFPLDYRCTWVSLALDWWSGPASCGRWSWSTYHQAGTFHLCQWRCLGQCGQWWSRSFWSCWLWWPLGSHPKVWKQSFAEKKRHSQFCVQQETFSKCWEMWICIQCMREKLPGNFEI